MYLVIPLFVQINGQNDKTAFLMDKNMKNISVLTMLLSILAV
nr:MAG TPA: hypothetical protein [Caudoviricetes sp.]